MPELTEMKPKERPIPDKIGLTVDSALICRLGYELVGRAETAVSYYRSIHEHFTGGALAHKGKQYVPNLI